jgi:diguanylate cyclase (GGDEF)-like protein
MHMTTNGVPAAPEDHVADAAVKDQAPLTATSSDAASVPAPIRDLQKSLRQLDRRDWWLWATAAIILLLLCAAIFSLSFPSVGRSEEVFFQDQVDIGIRGLFAMVLIFTLFALYQQYLIKQLRSKLQAQIAVVGELHGRAETFERLAILDPLTGLFNRRFAIEYLPREIARCERSNQSLVIIMIDLDGFKQINDSQGHAAGDAALEGFARHIKKATRNADLPVRMGGDEFMIILPECRTEDVFRPIERIRGCEVPYGDGTISVKFSVGWAQHQPGELPGELLRRADEALYAQKHARTVASG